MEHNTAADGNPTPATEEKTFSQDQLNQIVAERLAREKTKYEAANAEKEQELAHRELMLTAKEMLVENGLSLDLLGAINASSEEALKASVATIKKVFDGAPAPRKRFYGVTPGERHSGIPGDRAQVDVREAMGLK